MWAVAWIVLGSQGAIVLTYVNWIIYGFSYIALIAIVSIIQFFYSSKFISNFKYQISVKYIIIYHGVFTKSKATIPFSRIQNISITRGVFDRLFNLSTIKIETAGYSGAAQPNTPIKPEGYIPGLKDPGKIEKIIYQISQEYKQEIPGMTETTEKKMFRNKDIEFDEFIAYIINKIEESGKLNPKIEELRKSKGMSEEKLAELVGVSKQTIISMEQGKYVPSLTLAMKIARVLNESVENTFETKVKG